jgi:hypothetical protein
MQSMPAHSASSDNSAAFSSVEVSAVLSVACAHIVLAQLHQESGDNLNATKHLIAHLHMLLLPVGSDPPLITVTSRSIPMISPPSPTLYQHGN